MIRKEPALLETFLAEAIGAGASIDAAEALGLAATAIAPSRELRARLTTSLEATHRFDDLEESVAKLADLSIGDARTLLLRLDMPSADWKSSPVPGVELLHFEGGARVKNAITGFVRLAPGATFPEHDHVGVENVIIVQGTCEDSSGRIYASGDIAERGTASSHSYRGVGSLPLITMAVVEGGIILDGETILPGDPRA